MANYRDTHKICSGYDCRNICAVGFRRNVSKDVADKKTVPNLLSLLY